MTNDQANAANVLEGTLDLIRQILIKHETAVIAEFRAIIEAKTHELKLIYAERDALIGDKDEYCEVLRVLGMEEEGSAVEEILRLVKAETDLRNECDKWKLLAEYEYGTRRYPENLDLAQGALDAYFAKFNWEDAKKRFYADRVGALGILEPR